jgi:ubiquinone biosynthesis protein UbiJ
VTITASVAALDRVLWDGGDLDAAMRDGQVEVDGDLATVRRFVELFPLPATAPTAG